MKLVYRAMVTISFAGILGSAVYEVKQRESFERRVNTARAQERELTAQLGRLELEQQETVERIARISAPAKELRREAAEIHRLRGELTGLKSQMRSQDGDNDTSITGARLKELVSRIEALQDLPRRFPQFAIPELGMLSDDDWMDLAKYPQADNMDDDVSARIMFRSVRRHAKFNFGSRLHNALRKYLASHNGLFPGNTFDLKPYLNDPVDESLLKRYEILRTGSIEQLTQNPAAIVLAEKAPVDREYDTRLVFIGTNQVRVHDIHDPKLP